MAGKGGGAWKVAYADFVTAMMAFFLVMWITAQNKPVKEAVANYFENPTASEPGSGSIRQNLPIPDSLPGAHRTGRGEGNGPTVSIINGTPKREGAVRPPKLRIFQKVHQTRSAGTMVLFSEDSAELDDSALDQLGALVPHLLGKPHKIELRGHAMRQPEGDAASDRIWQLCYARCLATLDFLTAQGIERDRIRLSLAGSAEPYSRNMDPEWRAHNSRVEIFAVSEYIQPFEPPGEDRTGLFAEPAATAEEEPHGPAADAKTDHKKASPAPAKAKSSHH